jgi:hypothetical protein
LLLGRGLFLSSIKKNHYEEYGFEQVIQQLFDDGHILEPYFKVVNSYDSEYDAESVIVAFRKI